MDCRVLWRSQLSAKFTVLSQCRPRAFEAETPRPLKRFQPTMTLSRWLELTPNSKVCRSSICRSGEPYMDENRTSGTAKNVGGKVEEGFGRVTGDAKTKAQGQMKQAEGSIQDLYGQAVDAAEDTIDAVRKMPASLDDTIRHYIENNPYTTAAIALGLGWLMGRLHRPF
jgi:uncharacterized protein YjbJ (UPF0337 family)